MTNTTITATAPRAIYAGIGWRETPQTTLADMTRMARFAGDSAARACLFKPSRRKNPAGCIHHLPWSSSCIHSNTLSPSLPPP